MSSSKCAAKEGLCNHALALLLLVALLKGQGYKEASPRLAARSSLNNGGVPVAPGLLPPATTMSIEAACEKAGLPKPVNLTLRCEEESEGHRRDGRGNPRSERGLCAIGDSPFVKHLRSVQVLGTNSSFGAVPEASPLSYQQLMALHEFQTYVSPNIALCARGTSTAQRPTWPVPFKSVNTSKPATGSLANAEKNLHEVLST